MKKVTLVLVIYITTIVMVGAAGAEVLSIYDIQYVDVNEHPDGNSLEEGKRYDCLGGVVVDKFRRGKVKLTVQDTNDPNALGGWCGIIVKNNRDTVEPNVFDGVNVGDWVSFTNVIVLEDYGNTMLQFEPNSSFTIESSNNVFPEPIIISPNDIAAPVCQSDPPKGCFVSDRSAEKYEAMLVQIENVKVTDWDIGAHGDNYVLQDYDSNDPNLSCWAADYMNDIQNEYGYHPFVEVGRHFCSVTGIVEQYKENENGYEWDYYQLLTTSTDSFAKTDLDGDCDFDFVDFSVFALHWLTDEQCTAPNWCSGADLTQNGTVNIFDLKEFSEYWLEGK